MSNLSSPMPLLGEFGVLAAIGIIGCFVSMIIFLPAVKQLRDQRKQRKGKLKEHYISNRKSKKNTNKNNRKDKTSKMDNGLATAAMKSARHPGVVIGITLLVTMSSLYLTFNLETEFEFQDFLPDGLDVTEDLNFLFEEFGAGSFVGEETVFILIIGDVAEPSVITSIQDTIDNMKDDDYVNKQAISQFNGNNDGFSNGNGRSSNGNITADKLRPDVESILSLMEDCAFGQNSNKTFMGLYTSMFDSNGKVLPGTTKDDIKQLYDWLHFNTDKDTRVVLHYDEEKDEYDALVLRISISTQNSEPKSFKTLDQLSTDKNPLEDNSNVDSSVVTGGPIMFNTIMKILNESQLRSLVITIIMCSIILTIVFWREERSLTLGLITTLPVVLVIAWTLGSMFLAGLSLNIMTITIASLTIGLGVTYGIHITHRFLEDIEKYPDIDKAVHSTIKHTGTALFGAAATTIAAFGMLVFALLPPVQQFGGISALTIFFSFLSCVFVLPAFLVLWARYQQKRGRLPTQQHGKSKTGKEKSKKARSEDSKTEEAENDDTVQESPESKKPKSETKKKSSKKETKE
jgi:predicted RND superfamily exporter protein